MTQYHDDTYMQMVRDILNRGTKKSSRAGEVISTFGGQYVYDIENGDAFPLLTTKKMELKNIYHELCWFLRGETNVKTLKAPQLWLPWANKETGELGPVYGKQWRFWESLVTEVRHGIRLAVQKQPIDQIQRLIEGIKKDPQGRRHIVSAWNVSDIDSMALPPCHCFFQVFVENIEGVNYMDLQLYQRSADTAIGVPYNIASYSLLLMMLAKATNCRARRFIHTLGDMHIYTNHLDKLAIQRQRLPEKSPKVWINKSKSFWELVEDDDFADIVLEDYYHYGFLKFEVAV